MKKLFELLGKNKRNEDIKLISETGDNLVNFIKYYEKSGNKYIPIFGYNTPHVLKIATELGRFGIIYHIQGYSVDRGVSYTMFHGEMKLDIVIKPLENIILCEIFENGQKVKELYINKESYNRLNKIVKKRNIRPNSSLNIPSFMR